MSCIGVVVIFIQLTGRTIGETVESHSSASIVEIPLDNLVLMTISFVKQLRTVSFSPILLLLIVICWSVFIFVNIDHTMEVVQKFSFRQSVSHPPRYENRIRRESVPVNQSILVAKLFAMRHGGQLGNQVFETMSFIAIAKKLNRTPVFVIGDDFSHRTTPTIWNLITHFPNILTDVPIYVDREFWTRKWRLMRMIGCSSCYEDVVERHKNFVNNTVLILEGTYMQNYKYLDFLPRSEILERLRFPKESATLTGDLVPEKAFLTDKRLCVHTRRTDFITKGHQFSTDDYMFKAIQNITRSETTSYSIILFGDDPKFLGEFVNAARYKEWQNTTYIPYNGEKDAKFQLPVHFVWLFFQQQCHSILLTASTSSFGFWGAWLTENATVFYNPPPLQPNGKRTKEYPPEWRELAL